MSFVCVYTQKQFCLFSSFVVVFVFQTLFSAQQKEIWCCKLLIKNITLTVFISVLWIWNRTRPRELVQNQHIFRALINSLVCWFTFTDLLERTVLSHILLCAWCTFCENPQLCRKMVNGTVQKPVFGVLPCSENQTLDSSSSLETTGKEMRYLERHMLRWQTLLVWNI